MAELFDDIPRDPEKEPENKKQKQELEEFPIVEEPPPIPEHAYEDSDEENEMYLCGRTKEEADKIWHQYSQQIHDSEGFDFDPAVYPGGSPFAVYIACPDFKEDSILYDMVTVMAREALKDFMDDSGKRYELMDVVNLVETTNRLYYITFTTRQCCDPSVKADTADIVKTMQTICGNLFIHYSIGQCRIKPTKPAN